MDTVLGTVALDELVVASVTAHWEGDLQDVVAALHQHEDSLDLTLLLLLGQLALHLFDQLVLGHLAGTVEEVLHHVEELGIRSGADILQPVRDLEGISNSIKTLAIIMRAGERSRVVLRFSDLSVPGSD